MSLRGGQVGFPLLSSLCYLLLGFSLFLSFPCSWFPVFYFPRILGFFCFICYVSCCLGLSWPALFCWRRRIFLVCRFAFFPFPFSLFPCPFGEIFFFFSFFLSFFFFCHGYITEHLTFSSKSVTI